MMKEIGRCAYCGTPLAVVNRPWADGTSGFELEHVDPMSAAEKKCPMEMSCYDSEQDAIDAAHSRYERTCELIMHDGSPACSECLAEQAYDAKFCDQCGAKVEEKKER